MVPRRSGQCELASCPQLGNYAVLSKSERDQHPALPSEFDWRLLDLEEPHQRSLRCLGSLAVARSDVLHGGSDTAVPECLPDQGEIHVSRHKMRGESMFQNVRVSFLLRQPGSFGNGPEHAEELRAIELTAFLGREQKIRAIGRPSLEPDSERRQLIE